MNTYLVRFGWANDNKYIESEVILTQADNLTMATKQAIKEFGKNREPINFRITWAEDITLLLQANNGVSIYMYGPFGLHDPFCSANRGKT